VALEHLPVHDHGHLPVRRAHLGRPERLPPLVEELAERIGALHRRLDVDDPVGRMGVQPVEAGPRVDERARRRLLGDRVRDADPRRHLALLAVDEDRQVRVNVEHRLLAGLAADPVDGLPGGGGRRPGQRGHRRNRHVLRPRRPRRRRRRERAKRGQRAEGGRVAWSRGHGAGRGVRPGQAEPEAQPDAGYHHDRPAPGREPQPPLAPLVRLAGLLQRAPPVFPRVAFRHRDLPIYGQTTYYLRTEIVASKIGGTVSARQQGRGRTEARVHGFGELEAVLMHRIWDHDGPLTVRDLFDELREERNIAYTTVMSTMDNLHRKGWLARERDGKAYRYTPVATREEYSARLMREAMAAAGDTEAVLSHFVAQMDGSESAALRAVLAKLAGGRA